MSGFKTPNSLSVSHTHESNGQRMSIFRDGSEDETKRNPESDDIEGWNCARDRHRVKLRVQQTHPGERIVTDTRGESWRREGSRLCPRKRLTLLPEIKKKTKPTRLKCCRSFKPPRMSSTRAPSQANAWAACPNAVLSQPELLLLWCPQSKTRAYVCVCVCGMKQNACVNKQEARRSVCVRTLPQRVATAREREEARAGNLRLPLPYFTPLKCLLNHSFRKYPFHILAVQ